jgi:hypothetical protein
MQMPDIQHLEHKSRNYIYTENSQYFCTVNQICRTDFMRKPTSIPSILKTTHQKNIPIYWWSSTAVDHVPAQDFNSTTSHYMSTIQSNTIPDKEIIPSVPQSTAQPPPPIMTPSHNTCQLSNPCNTMLS